MQIFERTQEKLGRKAKTPARRDIHEDFPLRGFVLCSSCNQPLTASWSTGRSGKHPYYRCKTKGCNLSGKSIRRELVENELEQLLQDMKPSEGVLDLTRDVVMDSWRRKKSEYSVRITELDREKKETDQRISCNASRQRLCIRFTKTLLNFAGDFCVTATIYSNSP